MEGASNSTMQSTKGSDVKRPDKVYPLELHLPELNPTNVRHYNLSYRLNFWADIISEDSTSELMNVLGIMFSMVGMLLKYKTCAWFGVLVAAVSYANVRSNHDGKQIMSTFLLSISAVVMCYLINPAPISYYLGQQQQEQQAQPAAAQ